MRAHSLGHLPDAVLLRDLAALVAQDRTITASLLAQIAEVDARKLYPPAGYPSMFAYCVEELHLSEDAAHKRIQAARTARAYPALFEAVADGRLHLTGLCLLVPHLNAENLEDLIEAASYCPKAEIEQMLAARSAPASPPSPAPIPTPTLELAPAQVRSEPDLVAAQVSGADPPAPLAPAQVGRALPPTKVAALSENCFALQVTIDRKTCEKLEYAQALLSHSIPNGDVAEILERALEALIVQMEKRKFAAAAKSRAPRQSPRKRPRLRAGEARRVGAGRSAVHVCQRRRAPLRSAQVPGVRSHRPGSARGKGNGRSHSPAMPRAQPIRSGTGVWRGVHQTEARRVIEAQERSRRDLARRATRTNALAAEASRVTSGPGRNSALSGEAPKGIVPSMPSPNGSVARARIAILAAVGAIVLLSGCAVSEREARFHARKAVLERRNQGLRELIQRAGEGPMIHPALFVVGVEETLIVDLLRAQMPYEHALNERFLARVEDGKIDLEDKYGIVTLTGSVLRVKDRHRVAGIRIEGGLGEVTIDSSAHLHIRVAVDDVEVLHVGSLEGVLRPSDKRWIAQKGQAKLEEAIPELTIPVSLSRAIPIPPIRSDAFQMDSLSVPLEITVSEVMAVGGKLWVNLRAELGEVVGSEEGVEVQIRKKKKRKPGMAAVEGVIERAHRSTREGAG